MAVELEYRSVIGVELEYRSVIGVELEYRSATVELEYRSAIVVDLEYRLAICKVYPRTLAPSLSPHCFEQHHVICFGGISLEYMLFFCC